MDPSIRLCRGCWHGFESRLVRCAARIDRNELVMDACGADAHTCRVATDGDGQATDVGGAVLIQVTARAAAFDGHLAPLTAPRRVCRKQQAAVRVAAPLRLVMPLDVWLDVWLDVRSGLRSGPQPYGWG